MSAAPPIPKPSIAEVFGRQGFVLVNRLAPPEMVAAVRQHLQTRIAEGAVIMNDPQVPDTPCVYGGAVLDALLEELRPKAEFCTGLKLHPTYCYGRIYKRGDELKRHRDRSACEISISLNLGQEPETPWPLHLGLGELDVPINMRPGDGLFYRGIELTHWREPFAGDSLAQLFLHYVDQSGPYKDEKFDRRSGLSLPHRAATAKDDSQ